MFYIPTAANFIFLNCQTCPYHQARNFSLSIVSLGDFSVYFNAALNIFFGGGDKGVAQSDAPKFNFDQIQKSEIRT